jgi:hypothetical protein
MVSSVLAQAILNNDGPDLVGSFRKGQEISRQSKVKELSGQALKGNEGALEELSGLDPEIAYGLGETLRARSAKDINDFIRDARIGLDQLKNGDVQGAIAFGYQRRDSIRQRGGDTTQTDNYISLLESGDIESAMQGLQGLVGSIDEAKKPSGQQESEFQAEALVGAINPSTNKPFTREEALQEIVLRKSGITARSGMSAQERIASNSTTTQQVADSQAIIKGASAGASERAKLGAQGDMKPQIDAAITFAKEQAKNAANELKTVKSDKKALNVYEAAMSGLVSSFQEANTGAVVGFIPALADDDRVLEASIAILSPVLKNVVREAGEGTFTEGDQKQITELMPTRRDNKEVAKKKIKLLDAFVRSKLSSAKSQAPQNTPSQQKTISVDF